MNICINCLSDGCVNSSTDRILNEGRELDDEFSRMLLARSTRATGSSVPSESDGSTDRGIEQQQEQSGGRGDTSSAEEKSIKEKSGDDKLSLYQWKGKLMTF